MNLFATLRQPVGIGVGLFVTTVLVFIAIIVSGTIGSLALARSLSQLAQPLCAAAIAVLMYLALCEHQTEVPQR